MKTVDYVANCQECIILIQQMLAQRQEERTKYFCFFPIINMTVFKF